MLRLRPLRGEGQVRPSTCQQSRVLRLLQDGARSPTPRLCLRRESLHLVFRPPGFTRDLARGGALCLWPRGRQRWADFLGEAGLCLAPARSWCVCPGTQHPSCVYAHPGARAFKTRVAVFWVPVLGTKQCAPAQAPPQLLGRPPLPCWTACSVCGVAGPSEPPLSLGSDAHCFKLTCGLPHLPP